MDAISFNSMINYQYKNNNFQQIYTLIYINILFLFKLISNSSNPGKYLAIHYDIGSNFFYEIISFQTYPSILCKYQTSLLTIGAPKHTY